MKFGDLKIDKRLMEKAAGMGFEELTAIQEKSMPPIISGRDVVGQAETGSGKTVAFGLPILSKIRPQAGIQALILTPTRELCVQVAGVMREFGAALGIKVADVYGGVGLEPQIGEMKRSEVVVATPGRTLDHISRGNIRLGTVRFLVLDEADKMFEMGFIDDVERIISYVPRERQTLMFSATVSAGVQRIMERHMKEPLAFHTRQQVDASKLNQSYYDIQDQSEKFSLLAHLLKNATPGLAIVFCATRTEADIVARNLVRHGVNAMAIHGGMSQCSRLQSLDALKNERTDVLVATDVAARGLDIRNVSHVYNYDAPKTAKEYIHRIGRTARAGEGGDAVTLLTKRDHDNMRRIIREGGMAITKAEMPAFERLPFFRHSEHSRPHAGYGGGHGGRLGQRSHGGGHSGRGNSSQRYGRAGPESRHDGHSGHGQSGGQRGRRWHRTNKEGHSGSREGQYQANKPAA